MLDGLCFKALGKCTIYNGYCEFVQCVLEHGLLSIVRAALGPHNPASDVLLSTACDLFVRHKCSTSKTALTCIPVSHQDVIHQAQH